MVKTYRAIVRGHILHAGQIDHAIVAEPAFKTGSLAKIKAEPQPAVTRFVPLERFELPHAVGRYQTCRFSLVELFPRTGRRHQLRRHMSHISHPIVGDTTHGDGNYNRFARAHFEVRRLLLVAWSLEFEHPASAERVVIHADCGMEFESVLNALRRESTDGTGSR